ncbi:hypothetical protein [Clostridium lacusfryxellense]|uniref:hypothetical protein n=1 Tax=Clostridium lacusfryxellense TaxID=205328 RepID=UPI001C0B817E|nr:hypothetical protein [Clostridium lacusfryxellense]MBU3110022.1 hypothetical protein [Clostridium lacusfryxellense]
MYYIYVVIGMVFVIAVGILVLKSRSNDENENNMKIMEIIEKTEYVIDITDKFTKDDSKYIKPIFTMVSNENGTKVKSIFGKALDGDGEINIKDAEGIMIDIINEALKNRAFMECFIDGNCSSEEKLIADNLKRETKSI